MYFLNTIKIKYWISVLVLLMILEDALASTWSEWWTYDGISGPGFWGLVNSEWYLCSKGKKQSPIDIKPKDLLYDPNLKHLHVDKHTISGTLINTGHDIRVQIEDPVAHPVNMSHGPFQYQYRISDIVIHFGSDNTIGSEHQIDSKYFPAEIQIQGWNSDIYGNLTHALYSNNGLAIIVLLVQVGNVSNREFKAIAQQLKLTRYKGEQVRIRHLSISDMIPSTKEYITYDGSMTQPGCQETVTWVIINKPIYASYDDLMLLRGVMQGGADNPKYSMENNNRPIQDVYHRPIRTNVNFQKTASVYFSMPNNNDAIFRTNINSMSTQFQDLHNGKRNLLPSKCIGDELT